MSRNTGSERPPVASVIADSLHRGARAPESPVSGARTPRRSHFATAVLRTIRAVTDGALLLLGRGERRGQLPGAWSILGEDQDRRPVWGARAQRRADPGVGEHRAQGQGRLPPRQRGDLGEQTVVGGWRGTPGAAGVGGGSPRAG